MYKLFRHRYCFALLALLLVAPVQFAYSATSYVTDELTVPMRSGASKGHRIIKFLVSGMALKVYETSEDGSFTRVTTVEDEKEGWVETRYLMKNRSARERLPGLTEKIKKLKTSVKDLEENKKQLEQQNAELEQETIELGNQLKELRIVAQEPAALADKNRRLTAQIKKVDAKNAELIKENTFLADENIKTWFMIGGGVALVSLFFGLVIPSFSWGRKKDGWGGGF